MKARGIIVPTQGFEEHYLSDGIYIKTLTLPKGMIVVGKKHITNHLSILLSGTLKVQINDDVKEISAPYIFEALAGSIKIVKTLTDCKVANILPTNISDLTDDSIKDMEASCTEELAFVPKISKELLGVEK